MLCGVIASGKVPHQARNRVDRCAEPESGAPSMAQDDRSDKRRCETRAHANPGENQSICLAALTYGKPAFDELAGSRIHDGLAAAKTEAYQRQKKHRAAHDWRNKRSQGCEDAAQRNAETQNAAGAEPPGQQSRGNLKGGVTNEECAEDPTQSRIVNRKLAADLNAGDRDVRSIKVGYRAQYEQPQHQQVAYGRKILLPMVRSQMHSMPIEPARVNMTSNYRFIALICNRRVNRKTGSREKSREM